MNKKILSSLLLGVMLTVCALSASVPASQVYYKNPGFNQLVQANEESNVLGQIDSLNDRKHSLNVTTVFMARVLKEHPDYIGRYSQELSKRSFYEKAVFLRGMRAAGIEHDLIQNISDRELNEIVNDPELVSLSDLNHLQIKEGGDLDYLWALYFATGDATYIRQIVEVLNRDDEILWIAYEWINREKIAEALSSKGIETPPDYSDLQQHIETQSKKNPDYPNQLLITLAAFWSLEANAAQDPTIRQAIQEITQKEPNLDYWKKIQTALGR